ncbi:HD domain-containing phosphohydrolase [Sulfuricurvum sp.]|uniref:HD domain-containing phosphohydrolase n=1 Tax=Sulfuricurvum sp. TaxID=2025608 RepID=UPI002E3471B5|nr:HD domain-containing phosphohydrolase [Sulfuricurvum sp.]HEX5330011.1 HD domain-containing phosphohydrolase [Sulfuricurvum sp.]
MKLLNHLYQNCDELGRFCTLHEMQNEKSVLVQMFGSEQNSETLYRIRDEVSALLPNASLIATTSAGNIDGGMIVDAQVTLSFSIFERTDVSVSSYKSQTIETIIDDLSSHHVNEDTKLLIVFTNTFRFDSENFIDSLAERFPYCRVAGGNAGDDFRFAGCEVFSSDAEDGDVVIAILSSKCLQVKNEYLLNIQTIGQEMRVTKSIGNEVIEINHQSPLSIYSYYLGADVADNLLSYGMEFPLICKVGDVDVARAPVAVDKERGSITFAGSIPMGSIVKFGYVNIEHIEQHNHRTLAQKFTHKKEAIYVYSCAARRQILGQYLKDEIALLEQIVPSAGFITYGEFFHDSQSCRNTLLNITTTMVVLSENPLSEALTIHPIRSDKNQKEVTLKALTTLITKTVGELQEYKQVLKHDLDTASKNLVSLNQEIVNTQREVILTLGAIGETRSQETGLHVKRVAEYSYLLAKLIGLSEEEATLLKEASPMHDIGKVGIPDHILNKPGKFTPEEFEIMKTHSELGYEMLKHSGREILKASAVVAYTHHERWDGKGYPRGLIGEEIPIYGRITAVADVFDALGHDRIYKAAWPLEKILELFKEERGKQFDPTMIDLFFEHLDQFLVIRDRMQD